MADIVLMVSTVLGGASDKEVRMIAQAAIDEMNKREANGAYWVMADANDGASSAGSGGKSGRRGGGSLWGRVVEGFDYNGKPNNYGLTGPWTYRSKLKEMGDGTLVLFGTKGRDKRFILGTVAEGAVYRGEYPSGDPLEIENFSCIMASDAYTEIVEEMRSRDVPQMEAPKKSA